MRRLIWIAILALAACGDGGAEDARQAPAATGEAEDGLIDNPRAVLFGYLAEKYRAEPVHGNSIMCIDGPDDIAAELRERLLYVRSMDACERRDDRIVAKGTNDSAIILHATVDCSGNACTGVGGNSFSGGGRKDLGYRMRRNAYGWIVEGTGPVAEAAVPPSPPPPPPPPPPSLPSLTEQGRDARVLPGSGVLIGGIADPREALFAWAIDRYAKVPGRDGLHVCIEAPQAMVASLRRRHRQLRPADDCMWSGPGLVLKENGEAAMLLSAEVDCDGRICAGDGGYAVGNLGAERQGVRLTRQQGGWLVELTGMMIIS